MPAGPFVHVDPSEPAAPACDITIVETVPADGASDAYHRGPIEFHLSEADPTATVVADFPGVQSTRDEGRVVVFTPTDPLEPGATYAVGLDYCHGSPTIAFTTSDYGEALAIDDLVGRTYVVELADARFPAGESIADLVASVFTDRLLVGIVAVTGDEVELRIALPAEGDEIAQDPCIRTVELPAGWFAEAPYFEVSGSELLVDAYAGRIRLADLFVSGTLASDGTTVGGGTLRTTIDARDLATALDLLDEETLCVLAEGLGAPCTECPDGASTCVAVDVDQIEAWWAEGVSLEPVVDVAPDC